VVAYLCFLFSFSTKKAHVASIARIAIPTTAAITAIVLPDKPEDSESL